MQPGQLNRIFCAFCALVLGLAILLSGAAKEWLHDAFANHEDTAHHAPHTDHDLCLEKEHHHCECLQWTLPACDLPLPLCYDVAVRRADFVPAETFWPEAQHFTFRWIIPGRGPPVRAWLAA